MISYNPFNIISVICFKIIQMGGYEAGEGIGLRDKKKNDLKLMTAVVG